MQRIVQWSSSCQQGHETQCCSEVEGFELPSSLRVLVHALFNVSLVIPEDEPRDSGGSEYILFLHTVCLPYDRSMASSKASSPHSAI